MYGFLKNRFKEFLSDRTEWLTCVLNAIMCSCMAYFYYDSKLNAPLIYSVFFLLYIFVIFFFGRKAIPFMYVLFVAGATQNITFINCTGFFLILFLIWQFPNQKIFLLSMYVLDIFLVCWRHNRSEWHLVCHFALCIVLWMFAELTRKVIEARVESELRDRLSEELRIEIERELRLELEAEIRERVECELREIESCLNLTEHERLIVSQLAEGKLQKEIEDFSQNTITKKIHEAMLRNRCSTREELVMRYIQQNS